MSCERFGKALNEAAAGAAPAPELLAHLASCERCRAELLTLRQALAAADEELSLIASATPSPELRARLRAAVAVEREPMRPGVRWLWAPVAASAVVVLAALLTARGPDGERASGLTGPSTAGSTAQSRGAGPERAASPRRAAPPERRAAEGDDRAARSASVPRRPDDSPPAGTPPARAEASDPVASPSAAEAGAVAVASPRRSSERPRAAGLAEVLVPRGEQEALLRLVALVHDERVTPAALEAVEGPRADLLQPAGIDIAPLTIVPLDPEESSGRADSSGQEQEGETP